MAKAATQDGNEATAQPAAGSARDAAAPAFNPLMANPAAAFAAATAIGFSFSTHMANAFFGALKGAVDVGQQFSALLEKQGGRDGAAAAPADPVADVAAAAVTEAMVEPAVAVPVVRLRPKKAVPVKPPMRKTVAPAPETAVAAEPVIATAASPVARPGRGKGDDLKRISGIGPKLEQVLNGMGIRRLADVAGWSEDEMRRVDAELGFEGRIGRDDWVGQAKALVAAKAGKK